MERVNIEIPISVGDKVYKTNEKSEVVTGVIKEIIVVQKYYKINDNSNGSRLEITFRVSYGCSTITYDLDDLDTSIFTSKKALLKHIMDSI